METNQNERSGCRTPAPTIRPSHSPGGRPLVRTLASCPRVPRVLMVPGHRPSVSKEDRLMQFRHLRAADLEGSAEFPGLAEWIENLTPEQCSILLLAPAGSGKTAAVGTVA